MARKHQHWRDLSLAYVAVTITSHTPHTHETRLDTPRILVMIPPVPQESRLDNARNLAMFPLPQTPPHPQETGYGTHLRDTRLDT